MREMEMVDAAASVRGNRCKMLSEETDLIDR